MRMCAALAAIALAACGGRKADGDHAPAARDAATAPQPRVAPPATRTPSHTLDEPAVVLPREMSFTLLEPGDGARRALRYGLDGGERQLVARSAVKTRSNVDGTWSELVALATIRDGFGVSAASGVVQLRGLDAHVGDGAPASVTGAERYLARWRELLEKRRADVTVDARGRLERVTLLDDPAGVHQDARDELTQRWLGIAVPLPDEPVGVGARWRVVTALRSGGVVLKQTATYRLAAAGDDAWTIDVDTVRIGEPQNIAVPGKPGAVAGELVAFKRTVEGTLVVGRSDPLPLRGRLVADVSAHGRVKLTTTKTSEQFSEDSATIELTGE